MSTDNLTAPWGWGWHAVNISQGTEVAFDVWDSGPESSTIRQWKVAMTWDEPSLTNAADIILRVYNTCPLGGGAPVLVASQTGYDVRKRIELKQNEIGGACLRYHIIGRSIPAGEVRAVYVADYFHSGDPADH